MPNSLAIRTLAPHDWPIYRDMRLRSLADSPDAFGSTLAEEKDRTPEEWAARLAAAAESGKANPIIAEDAGAPVGLAWLKQDATNSAIVYVFQVWVAPESRGRGVATSLIREAINWAKARSARFVELGVTCGDTAARRLYAREGFRNVGMPQPRRADSALLEQMMRLVLD